MGNRERQGLGCTYAFDDADGNYNDGHFSSARQPRKALNIHEADHQSHIRSVYMAAGLTFELK
jgi:hypothetical protein